MHNRLRTVRKALNMSQREFGEKLGVSRDVISNLEYNRVRPKELLIRHVCELFSVSEEWFRTGEGEMFLARPNKNLESAIEIFQKLRPEFQDYVLQQIQQLLILQEKSTE